MSCPHEIANYQGVRLERGNPGNLITVTAKEGYTLDGLIETIEVPEWGVVIHPPIGQGPLREGESFTWEIPA